MAEAEAATHWSDQRRAVQFRDGLMIVLLIRRLLRLKNFAALRLGEHLVQKGKTWILRVERREMKGKQPFQAHLPTNMQQALERRYLDHHRLILLRGEDGQERDHDALWVSGWARPWRSARSTAAFASTLAKLSAAPSRRIISATRGLPPTPTRTQTGPRDQASPRPRHTRHRRGALHSRAGHQCLAPPRGDDGGTAVAGT